MSKQRDALRRGIRDLLQDTSRDLVAFEGREPRPRPAVSPAPEPEKGVAHDARPLNGGPVDTAGERSGVLTPPGAPRIAEPPSEEPLEVPRAGIDSAEAPAETFPAPAAAVPEPPRPLELAMPASFPRPAAPADRTRADRAPVDSAGVMTSKPAGGNKTRGRRKANAAAKKLKARARRTPASASVTPAAAPDDVVAEDAGPAPAESRTGVCRSYFVNHECWRVPAAYCNTALQICVIRNCPVYHLHKDALERRFAKKYKHFW